MKSARQAMDIVNAYETVGTYRGAAALCGTTHKTVKRVVERRQRAEVGRRPGRPLKTAGAAELIEQRLKLTDGRVSAKHLLPVTQASGYTGSLRTLQRAVKAAKTAWKLTRRRYRPWLPTPGQYLVFDWASEAGWGCFCAVLAWSHMILSSPNGFPVQSPYLAVANRSMEQMRSWLSEFGMSPASRVRVAASVQDPEETEVQAFLRSKPKWTPTTS